MCGAGRSARRARTLTTGGAYSHFGCRFDCPRGHRGKPHRREAAPGRGAPARGRKAAAALACVVQGGPGPAARGRHVKAGPAAARRAPLHGARMSLIGTSAPRVVPSLFRRTSTRACTAAPRPPWGHPADPAPEWPLRPDTSTRPGLHLDPTAARRVPDLHLRGPAPAADSPLPSTWATCAAMLLHVRDERKFPDFHSGASATRHCNAHHLCLQRNASIHAGFRQRRMWKSHIFN